MAEKVENKNCLKKIFFFGKLWLKRYKIKMAEMR